MDSFSYINPELIPFLAESFNLSRAEVSGVISFYEDFRTELPPEHVIRICQAEACQSVGARQLIEYSASEKFADLLDIEINKVSCLGLCACGPALMHNNKLYAKVSPERFDSLINSIADNEQ